eukprot:GFUD01017422.1.p1 GENE.GFUD01017422.1~~GFUD01017422.1.p1  ORF type:complete len:433 (-),score=112.04 GFUD01017422.1:150-1298(-)
MNTGEVAVVVDELSSFREEWKMELEDNIRNASYESENMKWKHALDILTCQLCDKHFNNSMRLAAHNDKKHPNALLLVCQTCNKCFKKPIGVIDHRLAKHCNQATKFEVNKTANTKKRKCEEQIVDQSNETSKIEIKIEIKVEELYADETNENSRNEEREYFEIMDLKTETFDIELKSEANFPNETDLDIKPQIKLEDDALCNIKQEQSEPTNNEAFEPKFQAIKEEVSDGLVRRVSSEDCVDQELMLKPEPGHVLNHIKKDHTETFVSHCSHNSQGCHIYNCSHIVPSTGVDGNASAQTISNSTRRKRKHQDDTKVQNIKEYVEEKYDEEYKEWFETGGKEASEQAKKEEGGSGESSRKEKSKTSWRSGKGFQIIEDSDQSD